MPAAPGLGYEGRMLLGILVAAIVLWVTEALPLASTALLVLILMPLCGVCSFSESFSNAINPAVFFLMGTFAFTVALDATTIPTRICGKVLAWSGTDSRKMLLGFMCACAFVSFFMSDVAACGVFISVGKRLLELNHAEKGKSNLGKAVMIAIPWASFAGGCAVLTGNGCNVVTAGLFASLFGVEITFVQWFLIGFPFAVVMLLVTWFILVKCFKPEPITQESIDLTRAEEEALGPLARSEKLTAGIIVLAFVLWILSSWISALNTAAIAVLAIVLLSVPGASPISFDEMIRRMNWGIILMIMSIFSVSHFIVTTGAGDWIVNAVVESVPAGMQTELVMLLVLSVIGVIAHNVIPVGTALAGIIAYPFGSVALQFGIDMYAVLMVTAWAASIAYLLPLDLVPVQTYSTGYYSFKDMARVGWIASIVQIAASTLMPPLICVVFGI